MLKLFKFLIVIFCALWPAALVRFVWHMEPKYFFSNYLYLASFIWLWIIACYIVNPRFSSYCAGLIAIVGTMTFLFFEFQHCKCNDNAMGWLFLWPLSIVVLIVAEVIAAFTFKNFKKSLR